MRVVSRFEPRLAPATTPIHEPMTADSTVAKPMMMSVFGSAAQSSSMTGRLDAKLVPRSPVNVSPT